MRKNHREMAAGSKLWEIYLSGCLNHLLQTMRNISISLNESFTATYEKYIYQFVWIIYCKLWKIYLSVCMNHLLETMRNISISVYEPFTGNYEKYNYQFLWIIYYSDTRQPDRRDIHCLCATSLENPHKCLIASSGKEFCVIVSHKRKLCGKTDYKDHHY